MIFRIGTKDDEARMLSSKAPTGSFLFRRAEYASNSLTLCVAGKSLKKYKILEVNEGAATTYVWKNQAVKGKDGAEEKFPTLNNLVTRKMKDFHLKRDFLDNRIIMEEKPPVDVEKNKTTELECENYDDPEIYGDEPYDSVPDGTSFDLVGTKEDEERMKEAFKDPQAKKTSGTFLIRPSEREEGIHTLCIMNKKDDTWKERKYQIQTTVGKDGSKAYSLKKPGGGNGSVASEETFPSLEAFIQGKWRQFGLQRNYLGDKSYEDMFGKREDEQERKSSQHEMPTFFDRYML